MQTSHVFIETSSAGLVIVRHLPVRILPCSSWMRTVAMCFSLWQLPRNKIHPLANSWLGNFYKLGRNVGTTRVFCTEKFEAEGGQSRRCTRRTINTKASGSKEKLTRKTSVRTEIISENTSTKLNTCKVDDTKLETEQYYNDLAQHATVICFDIETTGLSRENDRIIEIAFQDLRGGENSTFQTLVNPERKVMNANIHGISTRMVNKSTVPRMKELIPIILQYVRSRQVPGGVVLFIAHNGRTFDVPFLKHEFSRSLYEIPSDWLFVDTLPLARTLMKSKGSTKISLQAMREYYGIPLVGTAHRALSDVHSLALVLQRLTYDLKVPISDLIRGSFK